MSEIAQIKIDHSYFLKSRNEYSNPIEWIWFREAIQNSSDAKAKNIAITISDKTVILTDDGCGMSEDIILNKLLTLGGSHKDSGSVGGFGKAKEILFLTWQKWSITSSMHGDAACYIDSTMIGNSPIKRIPAQFKGTSIQIQIDDSMSESDWKYYAFKYIESCKSDINFTINGEEVPKSTIRGRYTDLDWARIMVNKSNSSHKCYVRMNGITMFETRLSVPITAVIELKGNSVELMNSSRETLRWIYRDKFDEFIANLNMNPNDSSSHKPTMKIINFKGDNILKQLIDSINQCQDMLIENGINPQTLISNVESVTTGITNINTIKAELKSYNLPQPLQEQLTVLIDNSKDYYGRMGYQYIVKLDGLPKPTIQIDARNAQTILHTWNKIVTYLARKTNTVNNLGIGLLFTKSEDGTTTRGQHIEFVDKEYILINPEIVTSIKDPLLLGLQLFPIACHEYAHRFEPNHNENFTGIYGKFLQYLSEDYYELREMFKTAKQEVHSSYH